ncbi:MAG TPA: glycosyltransferase N-terminal domain-containing protein [Bacteroidales bacterium]|nr:glycosyltransferase N-terminal domain-containing protein [Bacteroidales bacterium]
MTCLYSIALHIFYLVMLLVSPFNKKARLWVTGRTGWKTKLSNWRKTGAPVLWIHAASLGEFEQGRPLMEAFRLHYPGYSILLTFYSPSGYEIRKNYPGADFICYLPLDTRYNAHRFIKLVNPKAVFFIKYEFWYFYLKKLHDLNHPVYLISGIFRSNQVFFRWYGKWFRNKLRFINHFFVQDEASASLLASLDIHEVTVSGDTRFDRVSGIAADAKTIDLAVAFSAGHYCMVAGSTWLQDEEILVRFIQEQGQHMKFIIAPHETGDGHIKKLTGMLKGNCLLFSAATPESVASNQVLIIDSVGILSSLYPCGQLAYIGGGFGKGIHNILEAAVYGIPVIFGPNYLKFREAADLIKSGGGFSIAGYPSLRNLVTAMRNDPSGYKQAAEEAAGYVKSHTGATRIILEQLFVP